MTTKPKQNTWEKLKQKVSDHSDKKALLQYRQAIGVAPREFYKVQSKINLPEEEYNLYMAQKEKE